MEPTAIDPGEMPAPQPADFTGIDISDDELEQEATDGTGQNLS